MDSKYKKIILVIATLILTGVVAIILYALVTDRGESNSENSTSSNYNSPDEISSGDRVTPNTLESSIKTNPDSNAVFEGFEFTVPTSYVASLAGEPLGVDYCLKLLGVGIFYSDGTQEGSRLFSVSEESKSKVDSTEEYVRVKLPQSAGEIESLGEIEINGNRFNKYRYNSYRIITPEQFELIGPEYIYEIKLENSYLYFSHVTIGEQAMESILETFLVNNLRCAE